MLTDGFRIRAPAPVITYVIPATGINTTTVSITNLAGSGFWPGHPTGVILNRTGYPDIVATGVTVVDSTHITCTFDLNGQAAGLRNVVVTNPDGQDAMLADGFTVRMPGPGITGITPSSGFNNASINITSLAGSGFWTTGTTTVNLTRAGYANITATDVVVVDTTNITCTFDLNGQAAGPWNVVVINPDGQEMSLMSGFWIRLPVEPVPTPITTLDTRTGDYDTPAITPAPNPVAPQTTSVVSNTTENVTVNIGGDSLFSRAIVRGTGITNLIVTGTARSRPDDNILPPGTVYQYADLVPARYNTINGAEISFTVPQEWLDAQKIAPGSVVLYRRTAGSWTALPTRVVDIKDGNGNFVSASPGFSLFAIAGTPGSLTAAPAPVPAEIPPVETIFTTVPVKTPEVTRTTAAPAIATEPAPGFPFMSMLLIVAGMIVLAAVGFLIRRWWIQRQNPALFEDFS
jgi:hypothetical protein